MTFKKLKHKCSCLADRVKNCTRKTVYPGQISPLSDSCRSGRLKICKVTGDRKLCSRMASLGVYPGEEIELLCPENGSQCLLKLQGTTLVLDSKTTRKILVTAA
ncbi:MAG: ferrous iron transport protein A [Desulfoarculaceae bacterium]|nr:ferrous iron transport protein A [Desulfoarculaceae bacterium]